VENVVFSGEVELAVVAIDHILCALFVVVLADFLPSGQEFGAVLTVVVLELMGVIVTVHDFFVALFALDA
jgi:hypothetical protein